MSGRRALVVLFLLCLPLVSPRLRGADEIEYYAYLRSAVFDKDLDFANEYQTFYARDPQGLAGFKATFIDRHEPLTGRNINLAPVGTALLWSPFFLLAHLGVLVVRGLGGQVAADGFSLPYVAAACYASALYGFLGFVLVHDALVRFARVGEPVATWSVAALWWGTPALYYLVVAPGFSHACSLFAVALLLWLWLRYRNGDVAHWALLGAAGGLAGLVREQDVLFLAAPGLDLAWRAWVGGRWSEAVKRGLALAVAAALVFVPQLLAYHAVNGTYGPSTLVARKMSYASPHFLEVLFSPGHGLFLWSPLLLLAAAGLVLAWRRAGGLRAGARGNSTDGWTTAGPTGGFVIACWAALFLLQVWINGSVESWSQAGAFGSRRFVSLTPIFAWGLAALVSSGMKHVPRRAVAVALTVFVWWNLSLMVQFGLRLMDRQRLEWPRVAVNQVTEVPGRLGRTLWLYLTDRERLVQESR